MTFVITKPQQELVPIMTQINSADRGSSSSHLAWSLESPSKRRRHHRKKSYRCLLTLSFVVTAFLLLAHPYLRLKQNDRNSKSSNNNSTSNKKTASLLQGTVGKDRIAYYHQPALSPTEENHHLVLLHGSAFSKEDWKTSGILGLFGRDFPSIAITALDLPVAADHTQLKALLSSMRDVDLIEQLPISGLVTPSASGKSVTDWIATTREQAGTAAATSGSYLDMEAYLSTWIPVASYSVAKCTTAELKALKHKTSGVSVLAIYGDRDSRGKKAMRRLRDYSGATLLELPGKHPVYLDSPDAFVKAVGEGVLAIK